MASSSFLCQYTSSKFESNKKTTVGSAVTGRREGFAAGGSKEKNSDNMGVVIVLFDLFILLFSQYFAGLFQIITDGTLASQLGFSPEISDKVCFFFDKTISPSPLPFLAMALLFRFYFKAITKQLH